MENAITIARDTIIILPLRNLETKKIAYVNLEMTMVLIL